MAEAAIEVAVGNFVALVDPEDVGLVNQYAWFAARRRNASDGHVIIYAKAKELLMHRLILDAPRGVRVDHVDRNGLNNRRSNLRLATASQNAGNQAKRSGDMTSQYKGVNWNRSNNGWVAKIMVRGKVSHLGTFADEVDAARAYDQAAFEGFGDFALLNFHEEH